MVLFAAIDIGTLIPIVFFIIWVISQVVGASKQQPQARPVQRKRGAQGPNQPAGAVDEEIQQFLLETDDQRGRPKAGDMQDAQVLVLERDDVLPQGASQFQSMVGEPRMGELDTSEFTQRSSQLGAGVRAEESQMAARRKKQAAARHKKFDHSLGQLSKSATTDRSEHPERFDKIPKSAAAGLVAMLANGQSLRDAIIFSEIINRPADRW